MINGIMAAYGEWSFPATRAVRQAQIERRMQLSMPVASTAHNPNRQEDAKLGFLAMFNGYDAPLAAAVDVGSVARHAMRDGMVCTCSQAELSKRSCYLAFLTL